MEKAINKAKKKLKECKGIDNSIEMGVNLIILFIVLSAIINISSLIYTNFKVMQFTNEVVRLVELRGEVGEEIEKNIDNLKKSTGINPTVRFDKYGKINLSDNVTVTVELPYKLKIPFLDININIRKTGIGMSEVYWK